MNENFNIKIDTELKKQFKDIANKSNKKQVTLINEILTDYFKTRQLNKDFLTFPKAFYFNVNELLINKEIQAKPEPPRTNIFNYFSCSGMPINCDNWSVKNNSYCFKNCLNYHKGFIFNVFKVNNNLLPCYLYFNYLNNQLAIKLYTVNEFKLINTPNRTELLKEYKEFKETFNILENEFNINLDLIPEPKETNINNYIDNWNIFNYYIFKPFFIDKVLNNTIQELKANKQDLFIYGSSRVFINELEQFFKYDNDSIYKLLELEFIKYCKETIY